MTLPLPSAVVNDPAVQRNFDALSNLFPLSSVLTAYPPITVLPTTPTDGQVVYYTADATNGVVWAFKYRTASASASKWEFAGGAPLTARVAASETTASTTYVALTTAGPSVALPFAGDYDVRIGGRIANTSGTDASAMSFDVGGTGAVDADAAVGVTAGAVNVASHVRKTGATAVTLTAKYRVVSGTGTFIERWMEVLPVRVT